MEHTTIRFHLIVKIQLFFGDVIMMRDAIVFVRRASAKITTNYKNPFQTLLI